MVDSLRTYIPTKEIMYMFAPSDPLCNILPKLCHRSDILSGICSIFFWLARGRTDNSDEIQRPHVFIWHFFRRSDSIRHIFSGNSSAVLYGISSHILAYLFGISVWHICLAYLFGISVWHYMSHIFSHFFYVFLAYLFGIWQSFWHVFGVQAHSTAPWAVPGRWRTETKKTLMIWMTI